MFRVVQFSLKAKVMVIVNQPLINRIKFILRVLSIFASYLVMFRINQFVIFVRESRSLDCQFPAFLGINGGL